MIKWLAGVLVIVGSIGSYVWPWDRTSTVRWDTIVVLNVDGEEREFRSTFEGWFKSEAKGWSPLGWGGDQKLRGEAIVLDLDEKGVGFVLPYGLPNNSMSWAMWVDDTFQNAFDLPTSVGSFEMDDVRRFRAVARGRVEPKRRAAKVLKWRRSDRRYFEPMVVRFRDPNDPGSVEGVSLGRIGELFPGVEWARMDVEVTDAPVTEGRVAEHLPWLNDHSKWPFSEKRRALHEEWGRDRPSRADRPLVFFMRAYILVLDWERH